MPDPEDDGVDVVAFANFMRSTKAPPRGAHHAGRPGRRAALQPRSGARSAIRPSIVTAPPGTRINGGDFTVPAALGNKIIHPYSDFLLHDIGTGDGIPILPTPEYATTANQMRTAPLWALRTRNRLMHDGLSFTGGGGDSDAMPARPGAWSRSDYEALSERNKRKLSAFLEFAVKTERSNYGCCSVGRTRIWFTAMRRGRVTT